MKLEEVLPAMREGRVGVDSEGRRWKASESKTRTLGIEVQRPEGSTWSTRSPPLDGWSLEPERVKIPVRPELPLPVLPAPSHWYETVARLGKQWDALVRIARAAKKLHEGDNTRENVAEYDQALDAIELEEEEEG